MDVSRQLRHLLISALLCAVVPVARAATQEDVALIAQSLTAIAAAAEAKDMDALRSEMAPALRTAKSRHTMTLPDGSKAVVESAAWLNEWDRTALASVGTGASVEMVVKYQYQGDADLWEVVIRHQNDRLETVGIWYFVKSGSRLLVREAPLLQGPPDFKRFDIDGPKERQPVQ